VLLAASAMAVLLAAWALMSPPTMVSTAMTVDLLFNLAGAWHIYSGDVAYVDFHDAVGPLNFILTAIGFRLLGPGVSAFLVNVGIVTTILFVASFLGAMRRLPLLPAAIFVVFICFLALMPSNVGERPDQYTFAMSYNRYSWSAYSVLTLILFVPPRNRYGNDWFDIGVAGLLLIAMFYLKITYFAAGLATVAIAVLFQPHVRQRWQAWVAVWALLVANALAPYNHAYLSDILDWARGGAIRTGLALQLNNFVSALERYEPYLAAIVVSCLMWWNGWAAFRLPLTLVLLFAIALFLLSQNSQTAGLPSSVVMLLVLYDQLRTHFAHERSRNVAPWLLALLVFPLLTAASFAWSIVGYHAYASSVRELYVVDRTNLRGLAVPDHKRGTFLSFSYGFDYPNWKNRDSSRPLYQISEYEYVLTLLEAANFLSARQPGGIALFDQINPLPFMLGFKPARGANLWSAWNTPLRQADQYLAGVHYALIPKFSTNPLWSADLARQYNDYLNEHFHRAVDTPSWITLVSKIHAD
jgi:hypothetical protein